MPVRRSRGAEAGGRGLHCLGCSGTLRLSGSRGARTAFQACSRALPQGAARRSIGISGIVLAATPAWRDARVRRLAHLEDALQDLSISRKRLHDAQRIAFIRRRASVRRVRGVIRRINLVGLNRPAGGDYGDCKVTPPEVNRMAWSSGGSDALRCAANGGGAPSGLRWDGERRIGRCRCPRPGRARARTVSPFGCCATEWVTSMVTVVPADRAGELWVGSPRRHETDRCRNAGTARTRCVRRDAGTPPPTRSPRVAATVRRVRRGRRPGACACAQGEQAVVTDALEAARQDVLEKAVDEIGASDAQGALLAALAIGTHPQQDFVAVDAEDALVGDRHPEGALQRKNANSTAVLLDHD